MRLRFFAMVLLFFLGTGNLSACFILLHSDGENILVANHEDWFAGDAAVRINLPGDGRLGSVTFTFLSEGWPQGGMNEKGLFFDAAATPYQEVIFEAGLKEFNGYIWQHILDKAATVQEAIAIISRYRLPALQEAHIFLADATGDAAIIGVDDGKVSIKRVGTDRYLMQTNFNPWNPELSDEPVCTRYATAESILRSTTTVSVQNLETILSRTHQDSLTVYSNIYDLKNKVIRAYNKRDFGRPIVIPLADIFSYGDCMISLDSLYRDAEAWKTCRPPQIARRSLTASGKVVDSKTGLALPYSNIGIQDKNIGTLSDPDGTFHLPLRKESLSDSVTISAMGYASVKVPVSRFQGNFQTIRLRQESRMLQEITINDKKLKKKVARLGWMGGRDGVLPLDTIQGGGAVALLVTAPQAPVFVEKLQVRLMYNSKDTLRLRLHFYALDSLTQQPGRELLSKEIFLEEQKRFGWLRFDLSAYNIAINEKEFFVGFEWIDDSETRQKMLSGLKAWEQWKKEQYLAGNSKVTPITNDDGTTTGLHKYHGNMMDWPGFAKLPPFTGLMVETGKTEKTASYRTFERKTSFGTWTELPSTLNAVITVSY